LTPCRALQTAPGIAAIGRGIPRHTLACHGRHRQQNDDLLPRLVVELAERLRDEQPLQAARANVELRSLRTAIPSVLHCFHRLSADHGLPARNDSPPRPAFVDIIDSCPSGLERGHQSPRIDASLESPAGPTGSTAEPTRSVAAA